VVDVTVDLPTRVRNRGATTTVRGVTVFSWNPRRPLIRRRPFTRLRWGARVNNFGDLLGPVVVDQILEQRALRSAATQVPPRLLSVGSVLHYGRRGDVVWGTGVNGKEVTQAPTADLDVRAVRGPETRRHLGRLGIDSPAVYGDPALLLPVLFPALLDAAQHKSRHTLIAPNLNEYATVAGRADMAGRADVLDPRRPLAECIAQIAASERVVGSSLHGIVVAEALGIPAVPVASGVEHPLKYDDYYRGTGRDGVTPAPTIADAASGRFDVPPLQWDPAALLDAFPADLWSAAER
jgi:pyruvyltransferase